MTSDDGERMVDAALEIADAAGWKAVRLREVADRLDLPLARIYDHFPDLDALATAWLARADRAMLARGTRSELAELPAPERLQGCIMAWISALEGRRGVLRDVLAYRVAPPHVHLQAALLVATSRRVQWLREAAGLDARGGRKRRRRPAGSWCRRSIGSPRRPRAIPPWRRPPTRFPSAPGVGGLS